MSRLATGDIQYVKPSNNVYTVLVVVATIVQILALLVIVMRYKVVFGSELWQS